MELTNWAGNYRYGARALHHPETLDQLRQLASRLGSLQVLNTRHAFSAIGNADQLVALDRLDGAGEITIDRDVMTATVGPTVTYAQLAEALEAAGLALANMASLPHISVSGAVATGTHGSGDALGNLATTVRAMRLVTSQGDVLEIGEGDPRFAGAVVHLGALGIVTRLTLAVEPSYTLSQRVYENLEWDALAENLDAISTAGRSVSVFHRFGERVREVWVKGDPSGLQPASLFGAAAATAPRNPVPGSDPAFCTEQLGVPGPWCDRLPHFRAGFMPSAGQEIQSEWFVAREDGIAAITALREQLGARIRPLLHISETRTIAADELWMSPHHQRDSIGIHFTWHREPDAVGALCVEVERVLAPFAPRPHWGKAFAAKAEALAASYPRLAEFAALRAELDPRGAFVNAWLRERLLGHVPDPSV
ncbi:MAG: D-arabinono-1,4-lactone oxidase [Solirubrobacteraceae bacterium]